MTAPKPRYPVARSLLARLSRYAPPDEYGGWHEWVDAVIEEAIAAERATRETPADPTGLIDTSALWSDPAPQTFEGRRLWRYLVDRIVKVGNDGADRDIGQRITQIEREAAGVRAGDAGLDVERLARDVVLPTLNGLYRGQSCKALPADSVDAERITRAVLRAGVRAGDAGLREALAAYDDEMDDPYGGGYEQTARAAGPLIVALRDYLALAPTGDTPEAVVRAGDAGLREAARMESWPLTAAIEDIEANRPVRQGVRFRVAGFLRAALLATGDTPEACGWDTRRGDGPIGGPCVLRPLHDGQHSPTGDTPEASEPEDRQG